MRKSQGSFRDPSGFIFFRDGEVRRQINMMYRDNYDTLMRSGLYASLVKDGWLIEHKELADGLMPPDAYKVIQPEAIPFISYPYEWSFHQLKDAALLTLEVQKRALEFGMAIKDASAYNVQFLRGKPVFIDTLSFEKYVEGKPWVAYKQFCQHFFAPLTLMAFRDPRLSQLLKSFIDGIPLDIVSSLLPLSTRFKFSTLSHIHVHARMQKYFSDKTIKSRSAHLRRRNLLALIDSLESGIRTIDVKNKDTEWGDYYDKTNYTDEGLKHKKEVIGDFLTFAQPKSVWDLGANNGLFSRVAAERDIFTVSFDIDPSAVDDNYLKVGRKKEESILPLAMDLFNPSPSLGWALKERMSLIERGPCDMVFALALIHHLAISNNLPFDMIAEFFGTLSKNLVIEFVPKIDSQVQRLLATREDIFKDYTVEVFEREFGKFFKIERREKVKGSERILYLMIKY